MENLLETFIAIFVIMDPIGAIPVFLSMTKGMPTKDIRKNVNSSIFVATILLMIFLFFGIRIFDFFGINLTSFQIAGGLVLLITGLMYVFNISIKYSKTGNDLSVPLGIPLITGPGTITTVLILVAKNGMFVTFIGAVLALLVTWVILSYGHGIFKLLGNHWIEVTSRVMGILLAAIAVNLMTKGVLEIVATAMA